MKFLPLTADRWADVEKLFGPRGACAGCWCMYWRLRKPEFHKTQGEGNRRAFRKLVKSERSPGIVAYDGAEPVGWCAVAPREDYLRLEKSRILARVDHRPVWSISCLFVARAYRKKGVSSALIEQAARFAKKHGAKVVEGYPYAPEGRVPDVFAWTGLASSFLKAGFKEVLRRSAVRPIMRREF